MSSLEKVKKLVSYVMLTRPGQAYLVRYRNAPNPQRQGWWIPAPELAYGEHPQACCDRVLASLGLSGERGRLVGVDSFVTRDWHVLFHYVVACRGEPLPNADYEEGRWFALTDLPEAAAFAHGGWERDLVLRLAAEPGLS